MTIAQPHIEEITGRIWTSPAEDDDEWLLDETTETFRVWRKVKNGNNRLFSLANPIDNEEDFPGEDMQYKVGGYLSY